jgi:hypothetical protein
MPFDLRPSSESKQMWLLELGLSISKLCNLNKTIFFIMYLASIIFDTATENRLSDPRIYWQPVFKKK